MTNRETDTYRALDRADKLRRERDSSAAVVVVGVIGLLFVLAWLAITVYNQAHNC